MAKYMFKVSEVRTFTYPNGMKRLVVEVPIGNLPKDLPTEVNAREQNDKTGVARAIRRSLEDEGKAEFFHLLNRGIVLTASGARFDNDKRELEIELADPEYHGVLDGGHTYKIVTKHAAAAPEAKVTVEVLLGVEDIQPDIVEARNTSVQVDEVSLANVRDDFDPILEWLDRHGIPRDLIKVKQNDQRAIPMLDILTIMYVFDVDTFGNGREGYRRPPVLAYSGRASVMKHFKLPEHRGVFTSKMLPLLPDILYFWDYVAWRLQDHYRRATGKEYGRVGGRRGNSSNGGSGEFMIDLPIEHIPHRAYRLPLIAAMRCLVDDSGPVYAWREVPVPAAPSGLEERLGRPTTMLERFYESVAVDLHRTLWAQAAETTPNKVGKNTLLWNDLYLTAYFALESSMDKSGVRAG